MDVPLVLTIIAHYRKKNEQEGRNEDNTGDEKKNVNGSRKA